MGSSFGVCPVWLFFLLVSGDSLNHASQVQDTSLMVGVYGTKYTFKEGWPPPPTPLFKSSLPESQGSSRNSLESL